jgi:hypothetical protein
MSPYAGGDLQNNRKHNRQLILIFLSFWSRSVHSLLLLQIYFTAGRFVMGFVFSSSASSGRSGGCRGGGDVDDLHPRWLPRRLGLLLEEEGGQICRWRFTVQADGAGFELEGGALGG